jgi:hypothetical protein
MDTIKKAPELNYMTQIVFMLFEDVNKPEDSLDKYHVDIHFSPGIKGRAELTSTNGSSTLLKKSSPELPEKLPQFFVKRLSHISVMGGTESGASVTGVPAVITRTKPAGDSLSSSSSSGVATVPPPPAWIHGGDFFRRYVTSSRPTATTMTSSSSGGGILLSPKDALGRRRDSVPNTLRSFSDTRLVDRASKVEDRLKEDEEAGGDGSGQPHRKKSASESLLESMQGLTFGIGPTSHRYICTCTCM